MVKKSRILFASMNCFRSNHYDHHRDMLSFQNNLNEHVISLEKGDFKLSIGSLNNKFPYTVEGLLNILQSAQHDARRTVMESAKQRVMNQSWRKRQVKLNSNNIFEMSYWFDLRI